MVITYKNANLQSANDVVAAIKQFFSIYPQYAGRDFYIAGESYGGVFVPTTTWLLIQQLKAGNANKSVINLKGMSIGNGYLSNKWDLMTIADYMYFHGLYGKT